MKSILKKFSLLFFILLVIQPYIRAEVFSAIVIIVDLFYLITNKKINKHFNQYFLILMLILFGGLTSYVLCECTSSFRDVIRDIYYVINAISVFFLGFNLITQKDDLQIYYNSIILSAIVIGVVTILQYIFNVLGNDMSFNEVRSSVNTGHIYSCSLSIVFTLFYFPKKKDSYLPRVVYILSFIVSLVTVLLAFSRTNLLIILILSGLQIFRIRKQIRLKTVIFTTMVLVVSIYILNAFVPNNLINVFVNKVLSSFTEVSTNDDWYDVSNIQTNWRGYENYCAVIQFENGNNLRKIFGFGFGSGIDVNGYAYMVMDNSYGLSSTIQVLHNGYLTILIKNGAIGLVLYILLYIKMLVDSYVRKINSNTFDSTLLVGLVVSLIIITYFLNGLFKDTYILSIIILIPIIIGARKEAELCLD